MSRSIMMPARRMALVRYCLPRILLAATCIGTALPAGAQVAAVESQFPSSLQEFAFYAADSDADGRVDLEELARDAAAAFAGLDKDGSLTLSPAEFGTADQAAFAKIDANGDGKLTFIEVMDHKSAAFASGDKDKDGGLTYAEMVDAVAAETGATP